MSLGRRFVVLVVTVALSAIGVSAASADDIDTVPSWNGSAAIAPFGQGGTPTYGQTIDGTGGALTGFTVFMNVPGSVTFRGGVGVWNGSEVATVLWTGPVGTTTGSGAMEEISFVIPGGVELTPGQAYVVYASSLFSSGSGYGTWGLISGDPYPNGHMVWQNGGTLTAAWDGNYPIGDLAFRAFFESLATTAVFVPMPARGGYCTVRGNANPFTGAILAPGTFVDLAQAQVTSDPSYAGVVPANYVEGDGLTCDAPPAGYTQQGLADETKHVGGGFYPYWASPSA